MLYVARRGQRWNRRPSNRPGGTDCGDDGIELIGNDQSWW